MFKCQMVLSEITDIDPLALFKELSHLRFLTYVKNHIYIEWQCFRGNRACVSSNTGIFLKIK
jgi:hypothetical protein